MTDSKYKYICTAKCPELDVIEEPHCKCIEPTKGLNCPCGNDMKWEPIKEST